MPSGLLIAQIAISILIPFGVQKAAKHSKFVRTISPVVICYILGMLLGTQKLVAFDPRFSLTLSGVMVALAIPLLLFSVDFIAWSRLAGTTLLSFFLCIIATVAAGAAGHYLFRNVLAETPQMAGMLSAVYIGGTGNMNAVGIMLKVKPETFVVLNTSDMILSLSYLAFLMTLAGPVLKRVLRPFPYPDGKGPAAADDAWELSDDQTLPRFVDWLPGLGLSLVILGLSSLVRPIIPENSRDAVFILAITTLGILASFSPRVRSIKGTQPIGLYLLLIFFFCIGVTSDMQQLIRSSGQVFLFNAVIIFGAIILHLILCVIFKIDRDTAIITSTATIFSPPFVPSVAMALRNKEILVSGIASGLVGYAAANYVGAALAWLLS